MLRDSLIFITHSTPILSENPHIGSQKSSDGPRRTKMRMGNGPRYLRERKPPRTRRSQAYMGFGRAAAILSLFSLLQNPRDSGLTVMRTHGKHSLTNWDSLAIFPPFLQGAVASNIL